MSRLCLSVVSLVCLSGTLGRAEEPQPEPLARDSFSGQLHLPWKILRPDEKRWSLKKNKGKLTITTQRGTIHAQAERTTVKAKNLFLLRNPYGRTADFEVSVCISSFKPTTNYQQGGLILYDDDDNYVKFTCESNGTVGGVQLIFLRETEAKSDILRAQPPRNDGKIWLRLIRRKNKYEYSTSADGKKWTVHGEGEWGGKGPMKIGILAKNGGVDAPEIDVCFEDFQARPLLVEQKKKD